MSSDPGFQLDLLVRLLIAAVLGAAIGLEREMKDHPAGMRTHLLVSVGSATFTVLSIYAFAAPGADPGRTAAQIVSGIGFLGAGAILKYGATVRGLTTAASLWAVAAVGMAAGAGAWGVALGATAIVIVSLGPLHFVEDRLFGGAQGRLRVVVRAADTGALARLLEDVAARRATMRQVGSTPAEGGGHDVELEVRARGRRATSELLEHIESIEGVSVAGTGPGED